jgi:hypothetical protein
MGLPLRFSRYQAGLTQHNTMDAITYKSKIGKLTVLDPHYRTDDYGKKEAQVQCDCGIVKVVLVTNLKHGLTKSCGHCTTRGGVRTHHCKPRKAAAPSRKVSPVTTTSVSVNGRAASE